jgi:hypothetical protein
MQGGSRWVNEKGPRAGWRWALEALHGGGQAVKLLPQPHPPLAFGFEKVKPEPCIEET